MRDDGGKGQNLEAVVCLSVPRCDWLFVTPISRPSPPLRGRAVDGCGQAAQISDRKKMCSIFYDTLGRRTNEKQ